MRFVTIHLNCYNVEFVKDVGQIPYMLSKHHPEIESVIVGSKNLEIPGPNFDKIGNTKVEKIRFVLSETLTGCLYIIKNAKKIDWLNVYHAGRQSWLWNKIYKTLNPRGKSYMKLDMDFRSCDAFDRSEKERKRFNRGISGYDLVSVESEVIYDRIKKYINREIILIRNGYCKDSSLEENPIHKSSTERENAFITVGRLGDIQKATDDLLEAFAASSGKHSWKLYLLGKIETEFNSYIEDYFVRFPELKERVIFLGRLEDRKKIYDLYRNCKAFVLPSRWEGYPLVVPEALSCGLRMVITDSVPSYRDAIFDSKVGYVVSTGNIEEMAEKLALVASEDTSDELIGEIEKYAEETFCWDTICDKLYRNMK